jgi:hypothetical protein
MTTFPTWLTGPNGERRVFDRAEDVPEGWVDGLDPSVRRGPRISVGEPVGWVGGYPDEGFAVVTTSEGADALVAMVPTPKPRKPGRPRK